MPIQSSKLQYWIDRDPTPLSTLTVAEAEQLKEALKSAWRTASSIRTRMVIMEKRLEELEAFTSRWRRVMGQRRGRKLQVKALALDPETVHRLIRQDRAVRSDSINRIAEELGYHRASVYNALARDPRWKQRPH